MLNNDFVIIPRKQYENLLREKNASIIDEELREALDDKKKGRVIGPFSSLAVGLKALKMAKYNEI